MTARRLLAFVVLLAVVGAILALALSDGAGTKAGAAGDATGSDAATVERRNLVQTDSEAGTLSYAAPATVYDRLSGTITWLPSVGHEVKPGGMLFAVSGRPAILLDGTTPAYRELAPGIAAGNDVLQLNRNLVDLGRDPEPIALDDEWQAATTAGVEDLQATLGEDGTGKLALGEVVFLPGPQLVATVETTLGSTGEGSSGSPSGALTSDPGADGRREYASFQSEAKPPAGSAPSSRRGDATGGARGRAPTLREEVARLKAELAKLKSAGGGTSGASGSPPAADSDGANPSNSSKDPDAASGEGAAASAILQTTSTRLVVTVDLDASKQGEARLGERVGVRLPNGETVGGRVTSVSAVAESASGGSAGDSSGEKGAGAAASQSVPVTISLAGTRAGAGLDEASVSVEFAEAVARRVLSVPVTALLATGGADYAVEEAAAPHRLLPVTTGLFAAGYVQISGSGVHPGLRVSDSQG
jgi:hypothetical protein